MIRAIALAMLAALPAHAQPACAPRDQVAALMMDRYAESLSFQGVERRGALVEMWVAPSGTWTLTMTKPDGQTCVIADGFNAERAAPAPEGEPA